MKITIETEIPDQSPRKYIYEDMVWDYDADGFLEIIHGLMLQMGYQLPSDEHPGSERDAKEIKKPSVHPAKRLNRKRIKR